MSRYDKLMSRIEGGEQIVIDGGTGTEIEQRGVPQLNDAWNGGGALSHPDILGHKFEFAEGFIDHVKPYSWIGTVSDFGDWWAARDAIGVDLDDAGGVRSVRLNCPTPIKGLTLEVPESFGVPGPLSGGKLIRAESGTWLVDCIDKVMRIELAKTTGMPGN